MTHHVHTPPARPDSFKATRGIWIITLLAGLFVAVGAACSDGTSSDLPEAYGTPAPEMVEAAHPGVYGGDLRYLQMLDNAQIPYSSDEAALGLANAACRIIQNYDADTALDAILDAGTGAGYTNAQALVIANALVVTC